MGQQGSVSMPTFYQRHVVSLLASSSCHHHNLLAIVNLVLNDLFALNPVSEMRQGFRVENVGLHSVFSGAHDDWRHINRLTPPGLTTE